MTLRRLPAFASEEEEATWWYNNRERQDEELQRRSMKGAQNAAQFRNGLKQRRRLLQSR
jgi:hypothetical protein